MARLLEPREQPVPLRRAHRVRVQEQHLRRPPAEDTVPGLLGVADRDLQRGVVVGRDLREGGGVAGALGLHPGLLVGPVLVVDRDREVALAGAREPLASGVDLGQGVALVQVREAEEAQYPLALAEERVEAGAALLGVLDPGGGLAPREARVPERVVPELVAGADPLLEDGPVGGLLHVAPDHEADRRHAVLRERREEPVGDPRAVGGIGVQPASRHGQVVDGDDERPRRRGGVDRRRGGEEDGQGSGEEDGAGSEHRVECTRPAGDRSSWRAARRRRFYEAFILSRDVSRMRSFISLFGGVAPPRPAAGVRSRPFGHRRSCPHVLGRLPASAPRSQSEPTRVAPRPMPEESSAEGGVAAWPSQARVGRALSERAVPPQSRPRSRVGTDA